ncbi:MAG: ribonuclease III [Elusimicrobia bacterium RIFOXYA2_FULL_50_26]|nr:MAG: ribonuclease III [Elusimicrobia bacterium RIFOXYA2_FULL_50_26]OGS22857.1 MAG: ribonuclease III [Elusimicrobia bacterium RIFOXYB2_FULL_50_12]
MKNDIEKLEKTLDIKFENINLLKQAMTHKSYAAEAGTNENNERMEFLGDSILSVIVADFLFQKYPDEDEGRLSQLKSQIVSRHGLSIWAKKLKLGNYMYISKGEETNGGRKRDSLLSNAFEAVVAAVYLDAGFFAAKKFIFNYLILQRRMVVTDAKSKLQERIQSVHRTLPEYKVLSESGPDHEKIFEVGVFVKKEPLGKGKGHSKKEAEQAAAKNALKSLK